MDLIKQASNRAFGNVIGINKRFGRVTCGQGQGALLDVRQEQVFVEILEEPVGTKHRGIRPGMAQGVFSAVGGFFTAAR